MARMTRAVHLGFLEVEDVVHGGDDVIELGQHLVGEVELAVLEDVDLAAGEDVEVGMLRVEFADLFDLLGEAHFVEAVSLERGLGVVGDAEVIKAEFAGLLCHFGQRVLAVAGGGVAVERAAQVRSTR